jgi:hypothetical protein
LKLIAKFKKGSTATNRHDGPSDALRALLAMCLVDQKDKTVLVLIVRGTQSKLLGILDEFVFKQDMNL